MHCFCTFDLNVIVTVVLGGRADVPSVLAIEQPGADTLLLLFEYNTLGSKWSHQGPIEVKVSKSWLYADNLGLILDTRSMLRVITVWGMRRHQRWEGQWVSQQWRMDRRGFLKVWMALSA